MNLGDHGSFHARYRFENARQPAERLARLERRPPIAGTLEVGAGAERPVSRAGHDDHARGRIRLVRGQRLLDLADHRPRERVADLGPVQRDVGNTVGQAREQRLVAHGASVIRSR